MNEEIVIKQVKDGNEDAFEYLYEKYKTKVYRYIYSKIRNEIDTEDILQETFVKVYKNINLYRKDDGSFYNFLLINAKHIVIEYIRKKNRRNDKFEKNSMMFVDIEETKNLQEVAEDSEEKYFLKKLIDELCETQRIAINLVYIKNLSYKDAARVMGKTELSLKSILHRAKKTLKQRMIEEYPEMKDRASIKDVAKMIIITFVCMSMITGLGYAVYKIYKHVVENEKYTLAELREEVPEEESIISREEAVGKINEYLKILGRENNATKENIILIKDYKLNEICWMLKCESCLVKINTYNGSLIAYHSYFSEDNLQIEEIQELYNKFNFPEDYEICDENEVDSYKIVKYAKRYGNIYNKYQSVTFMIKENKLQNIFYINYPYTDSEILISKEEAKEICKKNQVDYKEIYLSIESLNNINLENYNGLYEEINLENVQQEELNKRSIEIRKVWKAIDIYDKEYVIDVSTGTMIINKEESMEDKNS